MTTGSCAHSMAYLDEAQWRTPGSRVFFTSDTHLGHARIVELSNRPFRDVGHMDEMMIANWNNVVRPIDTVFHLGDLALGTLVDSVAKTKRLAGRRFLVPGNHDRMSQAFDNGRHAERQTPLYEDAGWTVLPEQVVITLGGRDVLLSHYPYWGDSRENDRHLELRPEDVGMPLLHGHIHGVRHIYRHQFNVGVDVNEFQPVDESTILTWLAGL